MGVVMHIVSHVLATSFDSWKPKHGCVHGFVKGKTKFGGTSSQLYIEYPIEI